MLKNYAKRRTLGIVLKNHPLDKVADGKRDILALLVVYKVVRDIRTPARLGANPPVERRQCKSLSTAFLFEL